MARKQNTPQQAQQAVTISAPNMRIATFIIKGVSPYVQNAFTKKARDMMEAKQREGQRGKRGKKNDPRNFEEEYPQAKHTAIEGWDGMPASAFRNAMISACRLVGFKMTIAKLCLFVQPDGFDLVSGQPLLSFLEGKPEMKGPEPLPNADGSMDLRVRAIWPAGWKVKVPIKFDADQFTVTDVANLMTRVGTQIGIGAGRPDSKNSPGQGWGLFDILSEEAK